MKEFVIYLSSRFGDFSTYVQASSYKAALVKARRIARERGDRLVKIVQE